MNSIRLRHIGAVILLFKAALIAMLIWMIIKSPNPTHLAMDGEFLFFVAGGFAAQMIDGLLGMAYGVSCSTLLMSFGLSPAVASASVHTAEVFTTGVSGLSHLYFGNVDKKLLLKLCLPGVLGAVLGAYLVADVFDGKIIKPYVSAYLLVMGLLILYKSLKSKINFNGLKFVSPLGFAGGLLDAIGGGGWGPIVTSNIISQGHQPKETIGTVNTTEFFVSFFSTGVFIYFVGIDSWKVILGLIVGGVLAAPLAAFFAGRISAGLMMKLVGVTVIITSVYNLYKALV